MTQDDQSDILDVLRDAAAQLEELGENSDGCPVLADLYALRRRLDEAGWSMLRAGEEPAGITYMSKPLEHLTRRQLIQLIVGQDFVIQRQVEAAAR